MANTKKQQATRKEFFPNAVLRLVIY